MIEPKRPFSLKIPTNGILSMVKEMVTPKTSPMPERKTLPRCIDYLRYTSFSQSSIII